MGWESPVPITHCNGILNDFSSAHEGAHAFASHFGGMRLDFFHFPTNGWPSDVLRVGHQKIFANDTMICMRTADIRQRLQESPSKYLVVSGFSGGVEVNYQSCMRLTPEERSRIIFVGFGGARIAEKWFCGEVYNYVSDRDPVPMVSDPHGFFRGVCGDKNYPIQFEKSGNRFSMDHRFSNESYVKSQHKFSNMHREIVNGLK